MQSTTNSKARVRVLMAEDSPTQALQLRRILEAQSYDVQTARNGREALDYLLEIRADEQVWLNFRPTLLISDIVMPEMDGCQLCHRIKTDERLRDLPVILLTSLSDSREALRGLYSGADNLISKPYEAAFLLARVDEIISNAATSTESEAPAPRILPVTMDGQKYYVSSDRLQNINLILTTYETAVQKNLQLEAAQTALAEQGARLETALATIEQQARELDELRT